MTIIIEQKELEAIVRQHLGNIFPEEFQFKVFFNVDGDGQIEASATVVSE